MARIKSVDSHLTIPAGFHPSLPEDLVLPVRQPVDIPDEALEAILETFGGIQVLSIPDPEPEPVPQPPAPIQEPEESHAFQPPAPPAPTADEE